MNYCAYCAKPGNNSWRLVDNVMCCNSKECYNAIVRYHNDKNQRIPFAKRTPPQQSHQSHVSSYPLHVSSHSSQSSQSSQPSQLLQQQKQQLQQQQQQLERQQQLLQQQQQQIQQLQQRQQLLQLQLQLQRGVIIINNKKKYNTANLFF